VIERLSSVHRKTGPVRFVLVKWVDCKGTGTGEGRCLSEDPNLNL